MAKVSNNHHLYVGRAGHLACMSECLSRGWNVAIPEVDVGEDIFVVEDATSIMRKVQVKSATGVAIKNGFKAQYKVPIKQLQDTSDKGTDLRYVFVVRFNGQWQQYLILMRDELEKKQRIEHIGSVNKDDIKLTIYYKFKKDSTIEIEKIECGTQRGFSKPSFLGYRNGWDKLFVSRITAGN